VSSEDRKPRDREERFVNYLARLAAAENRAALAALRRGLGKRPGETADPLPYVLPWVPEGVSAAEETRWFLVASLFALHPVGWTSPPDRRQLTNLGASLALLARENESGRAGVERRFVALLNAHYEDLPEHLRHIVALLRTHGVPVDWAQLLRDFRYWGAERRTVQRNWARAFWRGLGAEMATEEPVSEPPTTTS
jgi:CRISPR system Cascade subunit CasB